MIVADPRHAPTKRSRSPGSWPTGCTWTTSTPSRACGAVRHPVRSTSPGGCPPRVATNAVAADRRRRLPGRRHPPDPVRDYPAGDVAANLLGFLKAPERKTRGGSGAHFDSLLAGKDGQETYEVGGGNRIPLGENTEVKPVDGKDLHLDHRPRRAVVRPAGAARPRCSRCARSPAPPSRWTPAPVRSSPWPTTRPSTPTSPAGPTRPTWAAARSATSTSRARSRRC